MATGTTLPPHPAKAPPTTSANIARHLEAWAIRDPARPALVMARGFDAGGRPHYDRWTFAELDAYANRCARGLAGAGFERGMRVLVMVPQGLDFVGLTFALLKIGAVPVLIDPGMGLKRMLACIRSAEPEGFIGIPIAHAVRVLRPGHFRTTRRHVTVGRRWFWGGPTLAGLTRQSKPEYAAVSAGGDEVAAILFTSGATGPPKGVVFTHGIFDAQVRQISELYGIEPGEVDVAGFPLFALFDPGMGVTCVIPDMNPTRPADADPEKILAALRDQKATSCFGSPALWDKVSRHCLDKGIKLPEALRRVLIAGAPVAGRIIENLRRILPDEADVHTPYGATESLPVASISGREVLDGCLERSRTGAGTCVGKPVPEIEVRFIRITDEPLETWSDDLLVPEGEPGEIVVAGEVVTRSYFNLPRATAAAKILEGDRVWHRIGDIGYLDAEGRIWYCGRKAHRVETAAGTLFSVCCEGVFNAHPKVHRSALVFRCTSIDGLRVARSSSAGPCETDHGRAKLDRATPAVSSDFPHAGAGTARSGEPVIVIEPADGKVPTGPRAESLVRELLVLGQARTTTQAVRRVLFHPAFPVDIRHNAKIDREALAVWAARQSG